MANTALTAFRWETQPAAEQLYEELLRDLISRSLAAQQLAQRLAQETGTRLKDWIDALVYPETPALVERLQHAGFIRHLGDECCYRHPGGIFPSILLRGKNDYVLHIKVESVVDAVCACAPGIHHAIEGRPGAPLRRARIAADGVEIWLVERHGYAGFSLHHNLPERAIAAQQHYELFLTRQRQVNNNAEGFTIARQLISDAIRDLGVDLTCDRFFAAERAYWMARNHAARTQFMRQQRLGFGWANHDHHTYRSSRACFSDLISIFEQLGFFCRERFYPGHNAGWGAQVLEQPVTGIVIFADVDMSEVEMRRDFSHEPFPHEASRALGTVGLWCALHGESFLQAGMHHLEATFDYALARAQLTQLGVESMPPFTDYPHLRQCFTRGENWSVQPERLAALLDKKLITQAQAEQFRQHGALGSHLEILERNQGFKGFNQSGVDRIIAGTDPRRQ
jgi:hypothetical protein